MVKQLPCVPLFPFVSRSLFAFIADDLNFIERISKRQTHLHQSSQPKLLATHSRLHGFHHEHLRAVIRLDAGKTGGFERALNAADGLKRFAARAIEREAHLPARPVQQHAVQQHIAQKQLPGKMDRNILLSSWRYQTLLTRFIQVKMYSLILPDVSISSKNVTKRRQNNWYRSLSLSEVCFSWLYFKSLRFSGGIFYGIY